jgi:CheY-like chemotaxis protein
MEIGERQSTDRAPRPEAQGRAGYPARRIRILVVDDNHDSADGVAMLLRHWGHDVRVSYDAEHAIHAFRSRRPDLVLLDIGLPGMDGYELAARLHREDPFAFLVALTGYTDRRRAIAAGFEEHFPKPVDPDVLRALLERI